MAIFVAVFFCVLNLCLWGVFLIKFKKIFSTDDIIAQTRDEMNQMISEINSNAGRNIDVIEDRIKQLKQAVAEADRHIELAERTIAKQKTNLSYQQRIEEAKENKSSRNNNSERTAPANFAVNRYQKNMARVQNMPYSDISAGLQVENVYELTGDALREIQNRQVKNQNEQSADLFEQSGQIISNSGTTFTVENDGSSYAKVPVLGGSITYADEQIVPKKKLSEMVKKLHDAGYSEEEIANELNCSTTEVQMFLDLDF